MQLRWRRMHPKAYVGLKLEHDSRRDAYVVSASPEKAGVNGIDLSAQSHAFQKFVVHSSTEGSGKRSIRGCGSRAGVGLYRSPDEYLNEGRVSSNRSRCARADQKIMSAASH